MHLASGRPDLTTASAKAETLVATKAASAMLRCEVTDEIRMVFVLMRAVGPGEFAMISMCKCLAERHATIPRAEKVPSRNPLPYAFFLMSALHGSPVIVRSSIDALCPAPPTTCAVCR